MSERFKTGLNCQLAISFLKLTGKVENLHLPRGKFKRTRKNLFLVGLEKNPQWLRESRLPAVSLFSWSVEQNAQTQMTTCVTEGERRERSPSFLVPRGFATQRSRARALPVLNLKKKRDCSQSIEKVICSERVVNLDVANSTSSGTGRFTKALTIRVRCWRYCWMNLYRLRPTTA